MRGYRERAPASSCYDFAVRHGGSPEGTFAEPVNCSDPLEVIVRRCEDLETSVVAHVDENRINIMESPTDYKCGELYSGKCISSGDEQVNGCCIYINTCITFYSESYREHYTHLNFQQFELFTSGRWKVF